MQVDDRDRSLRPEPLQRLARVGAEDPRPRAIPPSAKALVDDRGPFEPDLEPEKGPGGPGVAALEEETASSGPDLDLDRA